MRRDPPRPPLVDAYQRMFRQFGHQKWWPAETAFEVCIGAILVQNTAWKNVERAISNLKTRGLLDPLRLWEVPPAELEELIRPAGTFRVKAARVREFLRVLWESHGGSLDRLFEGTVTSVRARLLAIHGIGPETADCLLLYAAGKPSFVVDAYTRRVFRRHGWNRADAPYSELQEICARALDGGEDRVAVELWQDFHAQVVEVAKRYCTAGLAKCSGCPLEPLLSQKRDGRPDSGKPPVPDRPVTGATHGR